MERSSVTPPKLNRAVHTYQAIFFGDSGVGKSSIMLNIITPKEKLVGAVMEGLASTIGVDYTTFEFQSTFTGRTYNFRIWDTAGQERFKAFSSMFGRNTQIVFLVFSFSSPDSFNAIEGWLKVFQIQTEGKSFVSILLGNKSDLKSDSQISERQIIELKLRLKIDDYFECCAKEFNVPITSIFEMAVQRIQEKKVVEFEGQKKNVVSLGGGGNDDFFKKMGQPGDGNPRQVIKTESCC